MSIISPLPPAPVFYIRV